MTDERFAEVMARRVQVLERELERAAKDRAVLLAALVELHKLIDFDQATSHGDPWIFEDTAAINAAMKAARDAIRSATT